ncbi:MAG: hypothetical protein ACOZCL_05290 [Bacillota bacterium]
MNIRRIVIISMALLLIFQMFSLTAADTLNGWKGHGLFMLSKVQASILEENVSLIVKNENIAFNGMYTIRNNSSDSIDIVLAMPNDNIKGFKVMEKGSSLKLRKRTLYGIRSEFSLGNTVPEEQSWYAFRIKLQPNETKVLDISFTAKSAADENKLYSLKYLGDRKSGYVNLTDKTVLKIKLEDFKPYNIVSTEGFTDELLSGSGEVNLSFGTDDVKEIGIAYQYQDHAMLYKLSSSAYRKPKEIADAYTAAKYDSVIELCDQYLLNPQDVSLSQDQIKLIKAEAYRMSGSYDSYFTLLNDINTSLLYPIGMNIKLLHDSMLIYKSNGDTDKLEQVIKTLTAATQDKYRYLNTWMKENGFVIEEPKAEPVVSSVPETPKVEERKSIYDNIIGIYKAFAESKFSIPAALLIGLIMGFLIGRISKRNKGRNSLYLYNRRY